MALPPTNEPSAGTIEDTQDDPIQQIPHVNQNVPSLGANNNQSGPSNGPSVAIQSVDNGSEQTPSPGATPAESSLPSSPTDKEDTINHKGEVCVCVHVLVSVCVLEYTVEPLYSGHPWDSLKCPG